MKHTKEPWGVGRPSPNGQQVIGNGKGMMIAIANPTSTQGEVNANAERIVACINACAGITNDALEAGYIKHLVEWDEVNHNCIDSVKTPFEFTGVPIKEDV